MQIVALTAFSAMSHCYLNIWCMSLKIHEILPLYQPSFAQIHWKITEIRIQRIWKLLNGHFLFCDLESQTPKCIQLVYKSLSTNRPKWRERSDERNTAEKWWNGSRTDFQRFSSRGLDLCPMNMQMHRDTVLAHVYTPAIKWQRNCDCIFFLFCVIVNFIFDPRTLKCIQLFLKVIIYRLAKCEKDRIINCK